LKRIVWMALSVIARVAALLLLSASAGAAAQMRPSNTQAIAAGTFLNSLGVNTHVDQGYDPNSYIGPLRYLGIREVRDAERHVDGEVAIARATGVHFVINGAGDLHGLIASATVLAKASALLAVEGPNEPNNFPITYDGLTGGGRGHSWYAIAAFQAALFAAAKNDPLLAPYLVFGVSETGAETDDVGLQFRAVPKGSGASFPAGTQFSDMVNVHNYVSAVRGGYGDNQAWNAASPTLNGRWDGLYGNCGLTWFRHFQGYRLAGLPTVPRVTTETGWDSVSDPGGEAVQGAVLTNTYLAQFKRGWRYTFIYELRDGEGGPGHQGLYHANVPKPAAVEIHNLTTILADDKQVLHPGWLSYFLKNPPPTVHDLLLQKSSGEFDLVVWDERARGVDHVTVTFGSVHPHLALYDLSLGDTPVAELHGVRTVDLSLSDHAMIIALSG
jgi:hypothetical protein